MMETLPQANGAVAQWEDASPLLLTATIRMHPGQVASYSNPGTRIGEYGEVLRWLADRPCGIREFVFCENSGTDLADFEEFQELFEQRGLNLRLMSCELPSDFVALGKGWGEGWTIEMALSECPLLGSSSGFYKLTGRYKLINMKQVLRCVRRACTADRKPDFICGSFGASRNGPYAGTAFFWSSRKFYRERLMTAYHAVNDHAGIYIEHVFGSRLSELASAHRIGVLPVNIILNGISGFSGRPLMSPAQQLRAAIRNFMKQRRDLNYIDESGAWACCE
jgi:hypothetical protein